MAPGEYHTPTSRTAGTHKGGLGPEQRGEERDHHGAFGADHIIQKPYRHAHRIKLLDELDGGAGKIVR